jgi:hypothetical protein
VLRRAGSHCTRMGDSRSAKILATDSANVSAEDSGNVIRDPPNRARNGLPGNTGRPDPGSSDSHRPTVAARASLTPTAKMHVQRAYVAASRSRCGGVPFKMQTSGREAERRAHRRVPHSIGTPTQPGMGEPVTPRRRESAHHTAVTPRGSPAWTSRDPRPRTCTSRTQISGGQRKRSGGANPRSIPTPRETCSGVPAKSWRPPA